MCNFDSSPEEDSRKIFFCVVLVLREFPRIFSAFRGTKNSSRPRLLSTCHFSSLFSDLPVRSTFTETLLPAQLPAIHLPTLSKSTLRNRHSTSWSSKTATTFQIQDPWWCNFLETEKGLCDIAKEKSEKKVRVKFRKYRLWFHLRPFDVEMLFKVFLIWIWFENLFLGSSETCTCNASSVSHLFTVLD